MIFHEVQKPFDEHALTVPTYLVPQTRQIFYLPRKDYSAQTIVFGGLVFGKFYSQRQEQKIAGRRLVHFQKLTVNENRRELFCGQTRHFQRIVDNPLIMRLSVQFTEKLAVNHVIVLADTRRKIGRVLLANAHGVGNVIRSENFMPQAFQCALNFVEENPERSRVRPKKHCPLREYSTFDASELRKNQQVAVARHVDFRRKIPVLILQSKFFVEKILVDRLRGGILQAFA